VTATEAVTLSHAGADGYSGAFMSSTSGSGDGEESAFLPHPSFWTRVDRRDGLCNRCWSADPNRGGSFESGRRQSCPECRQRRGNAGDLRIRATHAQLENSR